MFTGNIDPKNTIIPGEAVLNGKFRFVQENVPGRANNRARSPPKILVAFFCQQKKII
jgi:hypothetical protein